MDAQSLQATGNITRQLAQYISTATHNELTPDVDEQAKLRLLDALSAMISGSRLSAGQKAIEFVRAQGGTNEATVIGTLVRTSAINAALANAMFGHADETDDFEPVTKAHPGSHVVPAALAMAEREHRSGRELLAAIVLGYDISCRFLMALGPDHVRGSHRSAEGVCSTMGAVAAAAALARLDPDRCCVALSYAAQQVAGLWSWQADPGHVEKAFDFSGMGARNGITAAIMAQMGFTGVQNVFDCEHNVLTALSAQPHPEEMITGLGRVFYVTRTSIKPFSVGYPIQAPLTALLQLRQKHKLNPDCVSRITVRLPADGARVVNNRAMPDVNCQYILATALIKGAVSFEDSHSYAGLNDPAVRKVMALINLVADESLVVADAPRSGHVEVVTTKRQTLSRFVRHAPGTRENPMSTSQVADKARALIEPVLGERKTDALISAVLSLDESCGPDGLSELLTPNQ